MVPIDFSAPLWIWQAKKGAWNFLTLPPEESGAVRMFSAQGDVPRRGFGSVRVAAQIGESRWKTSVFLSKAQGGYILPVKKSVRKAESLKAGDTADVSLEILL